MTPEDIVNGYRDAPEINYGIMNKHQIKAAYIDSNDVIHINFPLWENHRRIASLQALNIDKSAGIWDTWESDDEYYTLLFHEFGHSTGHPKRLNRCPTPRPFYINKFDKPPGWKFSIIEEELIACRVSQILCELAGIKYYGEDWHDLLKKLAPHEINEEAITSAAQEAVDYILGKNFSAVACDAE